MKRLLPLLLSVVALLASCDSRFNWYDNLKVEPKPSEAAATYRLNTASAVYPKLLEMGYTAVDSTIVFRPDFTVSGTGVPGCCLTGNDESSGLYSFTGGLYDIKGTWRVVKEGEVYKLECEFSEMIETTGRKITDPKLAKEGEPLSKCNVGLIRGVPFTIGFLVYNGDFWPVAYDRVP